MFYLNANMHIYSQLQKCLSEVVLQPAPTLCTQRSASSCQTFVGMCVIFRAQGNTGAKFSGTRLDVFQHMRNGSRHWTTGSNTDQGEVCLFVCTHVRIEVIVADHKTCLTDR